MLTATEKRAGRRFRTDNQIQLDLLNAEDPPDFEVPHFIGIFRHVCRISGNRTVAIELKEIYLVSPIYDDEDVPAGRFGFIYRQGHCRACGRRARSRVGRVVDGYVRPPINRRSNRSEHD